jgi:hypothetical protein
MSETQENKTEPIKLEPRTLYGPLIHELIAAVKPLSEAYVASIGKKAEASNSYYPGESDSKRLLDRLTQLTDKIDMLAQDEINMMRTVPVYIPTS